MKEHCLMMGAVACAIVLLSGSNLAQSQELPEYDRDTYCERVTQANADDLSVATLCLEAEQAAYHAMNAAWPLAGCGHHGDVIIRLKPPSAIENNMKCNSSASSGRNRLRIYPWIVALE